MKFYVICDNIDTCMGMRLAGMEGVVVHQREELLRELQQVSADPAVGVVLLTEKLIRLCPEQIQQFKLTHRAPLLVEIPDRHGAGNVGSVLTQYVREAVGINM